MVSALVLEQPFLHAATLCPIGLPSPAARQVQPLSVPVSIIEGVRENRMNPILTLRPNESTNEDLRGVKSNSLSVCRCQR